MVQASKDAIPHGTTTRYRARNPAALVHSRALRLGVLGPIEVNVDSHDATLPQAKLRLLLAVLAMRANKVVSNDTLIRELWGEQPPPTALRALRVYVSQLRKFFAAWRVSPDHCQLVTQAPGYRLTLAGGVLDWHQFERCCEQAREAAANRRPEVAARRYREALALRRGPALADVRLESLALESAALWLDEAWLGVLVRRIDVELQLGHHLEMIGELTALTAEHRLNEGLHSRLMIALYHSGRTGDALAVYRSIRELMIEELGTEPGAELQRVHQAVLCSDPTALAPLHGWRP
jgi:DNA-binding SARP family transcriptional activator